MVTTEQFMANIQAAGRQANEAGKSRTDCPLWEGSPARAAWEQGRDDAQIDREIWESDNDYRARQFGDER